MSDDLGDFNTALKLCCNQHRRIILAELINQQRTLTLNDLTKAIIDHNHHLPITDVSDEKLEEVYLRVYHVHVPKLMDEGVVNYDHERQLVNPTPQLDQLQPDIVRIIEIDPELEISVAE
ncbi:DUF7344 domain-containing protein [Haloprofundus salilacus]|uniref:DUF7344 domain-containing protein n=1 Tax=Haloprofundus salilacus TaxID=2876190 RepID=UPI001CCB9584|nr:hypothetical protein [Haloprofundus salilacus]